MPSPFGLSRTSALDHLDSEGSQGSVSADLAAKSSRLNSEGRKYVTQACQACRARRCKCDGRLPVCLPCTRHHTTCLYSDIDRRRGKMKKHELDALQSEVKSLSEVLLAMKLGTEEEALAMLRHLRNDQLDAKQLTYAGGDMTSTLLKSQCRDVTELPNSQNVPVIIYHRDSLPPEKSILVGVEAYFNCSYTLFFLYEREELRQIMDRVYRTNTIVDDATLCELTALAAIGSQYDVDNVPVHVMEALFKTASMHLAACIEANFVRGMKVLLCLSMYSFMTKRNSARVSIGSGLQLARWSRQHKQVPPHSLITWRRLYRTLAFMECWLSGTLGYQPDLSEAEIEFIREPIIEDSGPTVEIEIQRQMSLVGLMMAGVVRDVYHSHSTVFSIVRKHSKILDNWHSSLDPSMQLESLTTEPYTGYTLAQRRSLMLVHVLCMGTRILLQRRLLVAIADCRMNKRWNLDGSFEEGQQIQRECVLSARKIVNLLDLLGYTRDIFRRCWMCIGHAFSASSVLLFDVSQRLLYGVREGIQEGLDDSQACIGILEACSNSDRVAKVMLNIILPLHQDLNKLAARDKSPPQSGIYDLLRSPNLKAAPCDRTWTGEQEPETPFHAVAIPAMQKAIEVLGNPFGYERKFHVDSFLPGDITVPTWWN